MGASQYTKIFIVNQKHQNIRDSCGQKVLNWILHCGKMTFHFLTKQLWMYVSCKLYLSGWVIAPTNSLRLGLRAPPVWLNYLWALDSTSTALVFSTNIQWCYGNRNSGYGCIRATRRFYGNKAHIFINISFLACVCVSWDVLLSPVWDVQHLAEALSVPNHLVHQLPAFIVVGGADHKLFNLGKRIKINNWFHSPDKIERGFQGTECWN